MKWDYEFLKKDLIPAIGTIFIQHCKYTNLSTAMSRLVYTSFYFTFNTSLPLLLPIQKSQYKSSYERYHLCVPSR